MPKNRKQIIGIKYDKDGSEFIIKDAINYKNKDNTNTLVIREKQSSGGKISFEVSIMNFGIPMTCYTLKTFREGIATIGEALKEFSKQAKAHINKKLADN